MAVTIASDAFSFVDKGLETLITDTSTNIITEILPFITAAILAAFTWQSINICMGRGSVTTLLSRYITVGIVLGVVSVGGLFQKEIIGAVQEITDEVAYSVVKSGQEEIKGQTGIGSVLDGMADTTSKKAYEFYEKATDTWSGIPNIGNLISAGVVMVAGWMVITASATILIWAKLEVALALAVAPIFICSLMFKSSENMFSSWLTTLLQGMIKPLMVAVFASFFINMGDSFINNIKEDQSLMLNLGGAMFVGYIATKVFSAIPAFAARMVGGWCIHSGPSLGGATRKMLNGVGSAANFVANPKEYFMKKFGGKSDTNQTGVHGAGQQNGHGFANKKKEK